MTCSVRRSPWKCMKGRAAILGDLRVQVCLSEFHRLVDAPIQQHFCIPASPLPFRLARSL
jgi:hypothetical protein